MSLSLPLQTTLCTTARLSGVGLHSGQMINLTLVPAGAGHGVQFVRTDLPGSPVIPALPENINREALRRRTELRNPQGDAVATIEHLLAACLGLGLDNVRVELDGPEIPILDGSARPFVELIEKTGLVRLDSERHAWHLRRPVSLTLDHAQIHAIPADQPGFAFFAELSRAGLPTQGAQIPLLPGPFTQMVAPARTFVFYEDVEKLREAGLIRGGSLDCAIVLRDGHPVDTQYRMANELAAHKLLDLIGDFAILGRPVNALVTAHGTGHASHHQFIELLRKEIQDA